MGRGIRFAVAAALLAGTPSSGAVIRSPAAALLALKEPPEELAQVGDAVDGIGTQLGDMANMTNTTLNELTDQVSESTQGALESLNTLADQAASQEGDVEDSIAVVEDKTTAMIVDMQTLVPSMQDDVMSAVTKQRDCFASLQEKVMSSFTDAEEKVDALSDDGDVDDDDTNSTFLARRTNASSSFWPFSWGKKKSIFDKAEDAIIAANKTIEKLVAAIDSMNTSTVGMVSDRVLTKLEAASAQFQERCEIVVVSESDKLPDILATQASNVCKATDTAISTMESMVDKFAQLIGDKVDAASQSVDVLYGITETLIGKVQDAREAAETAEES